MNNDKILSLLGLMRRAGALEYTEDACKKAVSAGKSSLILLFSDSAQSVKDRFAARASERQIPCVMIPYSKIQISQAIGFSSCSVISVNNKGFADSFMKLFS